MPSFSYKIVAELSNNENPVKKLDKSTALAPANAQEIHDDIHVAGAYDLAPLLASIAEPKAIMLKADGDGFKHKFDGVATFSVKAVKTMMIEVSPNAVAAGLLDIEVEFVGADQRFRMYSVGD
jgi:hypothetical protein